MAEKTEEKIETPGKKKPPMMMIIIAVAVVALLGIGFAVVQKVSAKSKPAEVKKVEKGPVMVMDEFLVNLADAGNDHFLKVTVGLELSKDKGKTADSLKDDTPLIRDAILASLASKTRDQVTPEAGRAKLKTEIKNKVNEALGEEDVEGVYFVNFVTQ